MRWTSSPRDLMPCCSISLLRRLETRYCLFSPSKMPQAFSRNTRNCSKSKLPVDNAAASKIVLTAGGRTPLADVCCLDPVDYPGCQVIRTELGQEVIGTDLPDHRLIEYTRQRSMQDDMNLLHARVVADLRREGVSVHFRHLDVGNHHQELLLWPLALVDQFAQVIQRLATVVQRHHFNTDRLQAPGDLFARH